MFYAMKGIVGMFYQEKLLHLITWIINQRKNNHDRNQYRQTDHHEAIVSREIYDAAQKMLDASKYMKKGYPLPTLQVVDQGALKGFVPVIVHGMDFRQQIIKRHH